MKTLEIRETKNIIGGGISGWAVVGIGAIFAFISGLIDGIARPFKCH